MSDSEIILRNNIKKNAITNGSEKIQSKTTGSHAVLTKIEKPVKLCGYLNKLSSRGLIKTFKKRWFEYSENNCHLYYYRVPGDILPLGGIDIANAAFSFKVGVDNLDKAGLFEITCGQQKFYLEAVSRHVMVFWLQELQEKRREFCKKKTNISLQQTNRDINSINLSQDGLYMGESVFYSPSENDGIQQVLTPVPVPFGVVGEESALLVPAPGISSWSLSNIKTHFINSMAHWKNNRNSFSESSPSHEEGSKEFGFSNDSNISMAQPLRASVKASFSGILRRKSIKSPYSSESVVSAPSASISTCRKCNQLQLFVVSLKDDLTAAENELAAREEVIRRLQKQLDYWQREKQSILRFQNLSGEEESQLQMLVEKDRLIVNLEHVIALLEEDQDILKNEKEEKLKELEALEDQLNMYEETIKVKDEMIISLTNKVYDLEQEYKLYGKDMHMPCDENTISSCSGKANVIPSSFCETSFVNTVQSSESNKLIFIEDLQEVERLKDATQAYQLQNKFLNKEILELSLLREDAEKREKHFLVLSADWEAKYYQIKSKYLILLNEMHIPIKADQDQEDRKEIVNKLLQDIFGEENDFLSKQNTSKLTESQTEDCDMLGFRNSSYMLDGKNELVGTAILLQQKAMSIEKNIKNNDYESWMAKWHNYMRILGDKEIQKSGELKFLIRSGIPNQYRGRIWKGCMHFRIHQVKEHLGNTYYKSLLTKKTSYNPATKQIELDLLRTLPTNRHYEKLYSKGIPKLRRILQAYSNHNPNVGYCQGLNRLVAIALLFMNEEDAFWCLVTIVEYIMPYDYYSSTLCASQADQRVLKDVMAIKLPKCFTFLEQHNIDLSMFTFNWFLTIFVDNIPSNVFLRIWDAFLYEGSKVLFRFAIAFLKLNEEEIMQLQDSIALNNFLRGIGESIFDINRVAQIAFNELNPFPMKMITAKRLFHYEQVNMELENLERQRKEFRSLSITTDTPSDEDDDDDYHSTVEDLKDI